MQVRAFVFVVLLMMFAMASCSKKKEAAPSEPSPAAKALDKKAVSIAKKGEMLGKKVGAHNSVTLSRSFGGVPERVANAPMGTPKLFVRQAKTLNEVPVTAPVEYLKTQQDRLLTCCSEHLKADRRTINFLTRIELSDQGKPVTVRTQTFRSTSETFKRCIEGELSGISFPPKESVDEKEFPRVFRVAMVCQDSSVSQGIGTSTPSGIEARKDPKKAPARKLLKMQPRKGKFKTDDKTEEKTIE